MFELPKPIQQDNSTTVKLLYQAAQDAQEQQQQLMQMMQRNEQIRREAFGGAQKQLFDIASAQNVPSEIQNNILRNGLNQLTSLYKNKAGIKATDFGMMASDVLMNAKQTSTAYQQYLANGEKLIADLKEKGFDEVNMKTALANNMFEMVQGPVPGSMVRAPKNPTKLDDPIQWVTKEVDGNPQKYLNREASGKKLNEYFSNYKPAELKTATTQDLTGKKTVKVSYTEKSYPWTKVQEQKDPTTGLPVKINVLDTETLTDGTGRPVVDGQGNEVKILSTNAFENIMSSFGNDVVAMKEIDALGRDAIDDYNRARGVNPQQITESNFNDVLANNPGVINPFDANNRTIYSRLALTKKLMPQFGKFGDTSVTVDVAKPNVTNVYGSDIYTRTGNLRPEARFPSAWAQIVNQDADVMRVAENMSFQFDGKPLTGRRVGDRAQGQIIKDNGKRATVVARPEEPGSIYVIELDSDGEPTDVVSKLSGKEAVNYGAKISSSNGSDIKTFNKFYEGAMGTVVPMSEADKANVGADVNRAQDMEEGKALVGRASQIRAMKDGETINANNALVKLNGKEVRIKSIFRKDTGWFSDSPVIVTLSDNTNMTFNNRDELVKTLIDSNK
jgi:hypothetical protein